MSEIIKNIKLLNELRDIINKGKQQVAAQVNSILTLTYWCRNTEKVLKPVIYGE